MQNGVDRLLRLNRLQSAHQRRLDYTERFLGTCVEGC